jgi:hypothetical protein
MTISFHKGPNAMGRSSTVVMLCAVSDGGVWTGSRGGWGPVMICGDMCIDFEMPFE